MHAIKQSPKPVANVTDSVGKWKRIKNIQCGDDNEIRSLLENVKSPGEKFFTVFKKSPH